MTLLEWYGAIGTTVGLYLAYLGYKASKGELRRLKAKEKLPKLLSERAFYHELHSSQHLQTAYLLESILMCIAIVGAMLMFSSIDIEGKGGAAFQEGLRWLSGGALYLFSLYRFGRYKGATSRYEKTMARIESEIAEAQSKCNL